MRERRKHRLDSNSALPTTPVTCQGGEGEDCNREMERERGGGGGGGGDKESKAMGITGTVAPGRRVQCHLVSMPTSLGSITELLK